ncbi:MAG: TIGR02680 family protein [Acidimicrobiales bacterium]
MSERWVLSRAGIVNVYQYGDETLHFHGGRLLLRGVNGSGKSTAMNMLLPFLLDTDTRRIDAAGEQSGVLRSWMLADRDEQQPVGYLWLELRRGDQHMTIGCGIRANRSTDRVTTWWFLTSRRPGIDLALTENRVPLSIDALRATLGSHAVFPHDQRAAYRAAVRDTFYDGADIDQHIRLLHILRSPRVGDRIDLDLTQYLDDALPQLSEAAVDDAAQPLEDLEEHRRNVEELTRTCEALDGLEAVYREYSRAELHRRARQVQELADAYAARRRAERTVEKEHAAAVTVRDEADGAVRGLEGEITRLGQEIEGLKDSDAYKQGVELNDLRRHVGSLRAQVELAEREIGRNRERIGEARAAVQRARGQAEDDLASLQQGLTDLAALAVGIGLPRRPPPPPRVETAPSAAVEMNVPVAAVDVEPARAGIGQLLADLTQRLADVRTVRAALNAVDRAELALQSAERSEKSAEADEQEALAAATARRQQLTAAVDTWRGELATWTARLEAHRQHVGLAPVEAHALQRPDLAEARDEVVEQLRQVVDEAAEHHRTIAATLTARRTGEEAKVDELAERLDELLMMELPDPPAAPWQRSGRSPCLAELLDFEPSLDPGTRASLEAGLEAAGLLGAEVASDGDLVLADGELVAVGGHRVPQPLRRYLHPTGAHPQVAAVLDAISTDPEDLAADHDVPVVTLDGRFRTGTLRGHHAKAEAEHVGLGARRAALERQRAAAVAELEEAQRALATTDAELAGREARLQEVTALRGQLPRGHAVADAVADIELAERTLAHARTLLQQRRTERVEADARHGGSVETAGRTAADYALPADRAGLDRVAEDVGQAQLVCRDVEAKLAAIVRSVAQWSGEGAACDRAAEDVETSEDRLSGLRAEHDPAAARLAALEDAVGAPYQEVQAAIAACEFDREAAAQRLTGARGAQIDAHGEVTALGEKAASAAESRRAAEAACVGALPQLQRALVVPGLLVSALAAPPVTDGEGEADAVLPVVPETAAGARDLAAAVVAVVPPPEDQAVSAESVRLSLRRRRDTLGAGWDAEDRQPDESLPLHVEVTGPLGRMPLHESAEQADTQRRSMAGLLSAKQDQALRNLLQGLIAREVATKLHAARELVQLMNGRLRTVMTSQGIGVSLRWQRRDDLDPETVGMIGLLAKAPDLRTHDEEQRLTAAVARRLAMARAEDPEVGYRELIAGVLDYRHWHRMVVLLHRPGRNEERLSRRTALSEGEKKMVSYLPLFAAVAASCDALAEHEPAAPRFVVLDDAFAKVSEDNHAKLFGLLVDMDLDFVATSERLWGTHDTVPELAITEVLRDASMGVIVLEHSRWDGRERTLTS